MSPVTAAEALALRMEPLSRYDTPEPSTRQGRRNDSERGVQLLEADGRLSDKFEACLAHIFSKYLEAPFNPERCANGLLRPPPHAYLTTEGLDRYATETNGQPFGDDTKQELRDMLDVDEQGRLTLEGFFQIYQLQTENDEEETWRDLSTHGFDRDLKFVPSRREDTEDTTLLASNS
ncbi:hypothetical protein FRB99_007213 [Tulasnella sp. 403]|nr:hypothetical protein FRB99_007213 [Tulasnella sp. 403]